MSDEIFDFGMRLKRLREDKKLSQEKLGERVGVSKGSIYRYENNVQMPALDVAAKLSLELGTSLDYLGGLEHETVIRLPALTHEQETILRDFIQAFIENK